MNACANLPFVLGPSSPLASGLVGSPSGMKLPFVSVHLRGSLPSAATAPLTLDIPTPTYRFTLPLSAVLPVPNRSYTRPNRGETSFQLPFSCAGKNRTVGIFGVGGSVVSGYPRRR